MQAELFQQLTDVDTMRVYPGGSESNVVDVNLHVTLQTIAKLGYGNMIAVKQPATQMHMAKSAHSEHSIYMHPTKRMMLIGAECKGIEHSIRKCIPQLQAACGSTCLEMAQLGLDPDFCVVPGIAMAGGNIQFYAVHLLPKTFPVMVALSPELCLTGTAQDQLDIATWCVRLADFALENSAMISAAPASRALPEIAVALDMDNLFPKPVRDDHKIADQVASPSRPLHSGANGRLQRIMEIYARLHDRGSSTEGDHDLVQFPLGVVTVPGPEVDESKKVRDLLIRRCVLAGFRISNYTYRPLLLFRGLPAWNGWTTAKPPPELRAVYVQHLRRAVQLLNLAGVAHLDLRPSNIMWRRVDPAHQLLAMNLTDFEDAQLFGMGISNRYVSLCDSRHPFTAEEIQAARESHGRHQYQAGRGPPPQYIIACENHNTFYLDAITSWTQSTVIRFKAFMDSYVRPNRVATPRTHTPNPTTPGRLFPATPVRHGGGTISMYPPLLPTPTSASQPRRPTSDTREITRGMRALAFSSEDMIFSRNYYDWQAGPAPVQPGPVIGYAATSTTANVSHTLPVRSPARSMGSTWAGHTRATSGRSLGTAENLQLRQVGATSSIGRSTAGSRAVGARQSHTVASKTHRK
jgi:hypothetical protein